MPYIGGKRVTLQEWTDTYGSMSKLHTGPNGENPAPPQEVEDGIPVKAKPAKATSSRSKSSEKAAKAAVAVAMGVDKDSPVLEAVDVTGLDADVEVNPDADDGTKSTDDSDSTDAPEFITSAGGDEAVGKEDAVGFADIEGDDDEGNQS